MSNMSSEEDFNNSCDQSQEMIPGRKYVKKSKTNKKKLHKLISSTYKKKRCEFYNKGACTKGSQCTFSHSFIPDVAKKICKFFLTNSCTKGQQCPYSHNTKRYPCKFFHIQQHCGQGNQCRFSHLEIDPDFEQEFLKDNQEFLVKTYKQDQNLSEKYIEYIEKNGILNKQKKQQSEPPKPTINLPFIFGFSIARPSTKDQNRSQPIITNSKKSSMTKKTSNSDLPFSVRLVHKNRTPIPEKMQTSDNVNGGEMIGESNGGSNKSQSSLQKNQLQGLCSQKISQDINLTPQSKTQRFCQGMQYYMCSYN